MEFDMLKKSILAISLLTTLSATAHAGKTISDKGYFPSDARQGVGLNAEDPKPDFNSAFAFDGELIGGQYGPAASRGSVFGRYQGGPKGR